MTSHVSERDKEQVVIDLHNLRDISVLKPKNMGLLPQELDSLLVSVAHFVCRFLTACSSYARAPFLSLMNAGHACVEMLSNIAARTVCAQNSSQSVLNILSSTGSLLTTALYAALIRICELF
jgi:hypothetical protein